VLDSKAGEVIFEAGNLVQVLDPKDKKTFLTSKKILPEWLGTFRVKERLLNSYVIETIYGQELDGEYNLRRLQPLQVPKGSSVEAYKTVQCAGATNAEAIAAAGPALLEEVEPSHEEESASHKAGQKVDEDEGVWVDKEAEEEVEEEAASIGERIWARRAKTQATGGGAQAVACRACLFRSGGSRRQIKARSGCR
jgi:hypothetical protein